MFLLMWLGLALSYKSLDDKAYTEVESYLVSQLSPSITEQETITITELSLERDCWRTFVWGCSPSLHLSCLFEPVNTFYWASVAYEEAGVVKQGRLRVSRKGRGLEFW